MSGARARRRRFLALARHRRGDLVIALKNAIRRDAGEYGGRFTSLIPMSETETPDLCSQWFDFHFLGSDRFTYWNAELIAARRAFWDAVARQAYARAAACLDTAALEAETRPGWTQGRKPAVYPQFDGLTFVAQIARLKSRIIEDEPPVIHEQFRTDRRYHRGIGLFIVLDAQRIDRAAVEAAIDRFFALGQADWVSPRPVPRQRLPRVTEDQAWAQLGASGNLASSAAPNLSSCPGSAAPARPAAT